MVSYKWLNQLYRSRMEKRIRQTGIKRIGTRLNQLKQLQQAFQNITLFELNQPNSNRMADFKPKTSKCDLIYLKPSVNYCLTNNNDIYRNLTTKLNKEFDDSDNLACIVLKNKTNSNENDRMEFDSNETSQELEEQQWPPLESCDKICCNRYRSITYVEKNKCDCVFQFCCSIVCKSSCNRLVTKYECILNK